jgi:dienelactone hydrolase
MGWKRKVGIWCGGLILLLALGLAAAFYFGLFIPSVQVAEPGTTGRRVAEQGLLANYFPGRGEGRRPAILFLGGSEGGLSETARRNALALQAQGFSVLQLSYYRAPGQPPHLELIPLEYFSGALSWLQAQPETDPERIGIIGVSKGAEAALLVGARDSRVKALVAAAPSSVAWQGSSFDSTREFGSSWSVAGKPVDHLSFGRWRWWVDMYPVLTEALATLPKHEGAAIPVERISAPVMLICGEADRLWPACPMSRQLTERARKRGGPAVTLLAYPGASHGAFGQPLRGGDPGYDKLEGAQLATNRARTDGWPRVVAFLRNALLPTEPPAAPGRAGASDPPRSSR